METTDCNTDNDVITAEEKPTLKGVKSDIKKGGLLMKNTLYLWSKQVKSHVLMKELESTVPTLFKAVENFRLLRP